MSESQGGDHMEIIISQNVKVVVAIYGLGEKMNYKMA